MGASNHATTVPANDGANVANPFREYSADELMREYVHTDERIESGESGTYILSKRYALARELRRRDISARAAREKYQFAHEK